MSSLLRLPIYNVFYTFVCVCVCWGGFKRCAGRPQLSGRNCPFCPTFFFVSIFLWAFNWQDSGNGQETGRRGLTCSKGHASRLQWGLQPLYMGHLLNSVSYTMPLSERKAQIKDNMHTDLKPVMFIRWIISNGQSLEKFSQEEKVFNIHNSRFCVEKMFISMLLLLERFLFASKQTWSIAN